MYGYFTQFHFDEIRSIVINLQNCNYVSFTKLPWLGDSEGTFRSSSQAATCLPHDGGFTLSFLYLNVKQGSCEYQFYSLLSDPTRKRTQVYRFSCRRSIHSTPDRLKCIHNQFATQTSSIILISGIHGMEAVEPTSSKIFLISIKPKAIDVSRVGFSPVRSLHIVVVFLVLL